MSVCSSPETALKAITGSDASRMLANYFRIAVHTDLPSDEGDESAAVLAAAALKDEIAKAIAAGVSAELLAYHVLEFAVAATTATLIDSPADAICSVHNLFETTVANIRDDADCHRRKTA